MKNALILHGTSNTSLGNWFPWLKRELEKSGYLVWCPDLPHADHPDQDNYFKVIFGRTDWQFGDESVVIGHSSGGVTALKVVQHLADGVVINKCVTVGAPYIRHGDDPIQGLFKEPYDFTKIKKHAKRFIIFHSDDDPYVPVEDGKIISNALSGDFVYIPGQGHFNLEKGPQYKRFPKLLEKILE